jgi:HK97 family phage major capsid protein
MVVPTGQVVNIPVLDLSQGSESVPAWFGGITFSYLEQNTALGEKDVKWKKVRLEPRKCGGHILIPEELIFDASIGVEAYIGTLLGRADAFYENRYAITGTGSGEPKGVKNAACALSQARNTASHIVWTDFCNMLAKLTPTSITNAVALCSPTCLPDIMQMETSAGFSVFGAAPAAGIPMNICGVPILVVEHLPALGTEYDFMLVDFSCMVMVEAPGMRLVSSDQVKFLEDQIAIKYRKRNDMRCLLPSAITLMDGTTQVSPIVYLTDAA